MSNMNTKQETMLKAHLAQTFRTILPTATPFTVRAYTNWPFKLVVYHAIPLRKMTQWHVTEFMAWLVRPMEYSRSSCNQAARAISLYFDHIGRPVETVQVSTRAEYKHIDTVTRERARQIIDAAPEYYRPVLLDIYSGLTPPHKAAAKYDSILPWSDAKMTPATINSVVKRASADIGILPITAKQLQQSGIVHAIDRGECRDWIMEQAGLTKQSLKRYLEV